MEPITKIDTDLGEKQFNINNFDLFVFDLDNTLYLHDTDINYRLHYEENLKNFLIKLKRDNKKLAIASHNRAPSYFLNLMGIYDYFDIIIGEYPRSKLDMIKEIQIKTNIQNDKIIFFDDLYSNIKECNQFIESIHVNPFIGIKLIMQL